MQKRFKRVEIFLAITISAFVLVGAAYLRCSNFAGAKLLSTDLSFENPGQEDVFPDQQNQLKVFVSIAFPVKFFPGANLFERSCHLFFHALSLHQKSFILRC
jgi:hypothetical protein